jgi:hypothetical protein
LVQLGAIALVCLSAPRPGRANPRRDCLEATRDGRYGEAVALCRQAVAGSRDPFTLACLANALANRATHGGFTLVDLREARALVEQALKAAPKDPNRKTWEESAWASAVEIYAALGDEERMQYAVGHLTWQSAAQESQDRAYYQQLLERGKKPAPAPEAVDDGSAKVWAHVEPFPGVELDLPADWKELDATDTTSLVASAMPLHAPASAVPVARIYQYRSVADARISVQNRSGPHGSFPSQSRLGSMSAFDLEKRNEVVRRIATDSLRRIGCSLLQFSGSRVQHAGVWVLVDTTKGRCAGGKILVTESLDAPFDTWQAGVTVTHPDELADEFQSTVSTVLASFKARPPKAKPIPTTAPKN